jgi:hypothetical protein
MTNLFLNGSFEKGHRDEVTGQVPVHWGFNFTEGENLGGGRTQQPETNIKRKVDVPPSEHHLYFTDGEHCFKAFKAHAPIHVWLQQSISLEPHQTYTAVIPVFVDTFRWVGEKKKPEKGSYAARVRLLYGPRNASLSDLNATDWYSEGEVDNFYLNKHHLRFEFTPTTSQVTIAIEMEAKWGLDNNGFFLDGLTLKKKEGDTSTTTTLPPITGSTKIGGYCLKEHPDTLRMAKAGAATLLLNGTWGISNEAHSNTLCIGAPAQGNPSAQAQYKSGKSPQESAREIVERDKHIWENNPEIVYMTAHNEPVLWGDDYDDADAMAWYAQFEIERMKLMDDLGMRCCIGNFSTGTPPLHLWEHFMPAIRAALDYKAILGLHEYSHPWIWGCYGPYQPDGGNEDDEGWLTFRYRKVYRQWFQPEGLTVPIVIAECGVDPLANKYDNVPFGTWKGLADFWKNNHDGPIPYTGDAASYYAEQVRWYASELAKDPYVVGCCLFCWGNYGGAWADFDVAGTEAADDLIATIQSSPTTPFNYDDYAQKPSSTTTTLPPPQPHEPRVPYDRTYVLLHDKEWYQGVSIGASKTQRTVGMSADDAGLWGPKTRKVLAINPNEIGTGLTQTWYDEHYPGTIFVPVYAETPWEAAMMILPPLPEGEDWRAGQNWLPWRDYDFGEHPGGGTIGAYGCFMTGVTMIFRRRYGIDITPDLMDKLFTDSRMMFDNDHFMLWGNIVDVFPSYFDDVKHINRAHSASELQSLMDNGWEIILPRSDYKHYVYLKEIRNGNLIITDTWDGRDKTWRWNQAGGIRAVHIAGHTPNPSPTPPVGKSKFGLHDLAGGAWMQRHNMKGVCLALHQVTDTPVGIDCREFKDHGIETYVRINWGYAGTGTIPPSNKVSRWIDVVRESIKHSRGVAGWIIGNEINNPTEWPGGYPNPSEVITPEHYLSVYNNIVNGLDANVTPASLDPYNVVAQEFGVTGDPADWARVIYEGAIKMTFIALHAKTQGNDPAQVWSEEQFSHAPLLGRYLHLKTLEDQVSWIPPKWHGLPVIVTELNPQRKGNGELGWENDNTEWVEEAGVYIRSLGMDAVFYRYQEAGDQAPFGLENQHAILKAIQNLA